MKHSSNLTLNSPTLQANCSASSPEASSDAASDWVLDGGAALTASQQNTKVYLAKLKLLSEICQCMMLTASSAKQNWWLLDDCSAVAVSSESLYTSGRSSSPKSVFLEDSVSSTALIRISWIDDALSSSIPQIAIHIKSGSDESMDNLTSEHNSQDSRSRHRFWHDYPICDIPSEKQNTNWFYHPDHQWAFQFSLLPPEQLKETPLIRQDNWVSKNWRTDDLTSKKDIGSLEEEEFSNLEILQFNNTVSTFCNLQHNSTLASRRLTCSLSKWL